MTYKGGFNFSRINNFGRRYAAGKYLLLLNNDVEVINGDWLTQMVGECSQPGVGICGAMLYYPDDTIQHAGIITGLGGYAGHSHKYHKRGGSGYMFRLATVQDFSAVTAACLLVRTAVYDAAHGLDEEFTVAYNDVTSACGCGTPAGASSGPPMHSCITMRASPAAPMKTTRPKRPALTPSMTACMRSTGGKTSCMTLLQSIPLPRLRGFPRKRRFEESEMS